MLPVPVTGAAPSGPNSIVVGTLTLARCGIGYCGVLPRVFDPSGQVSGTIDIGFEYFPQIDPSLPRIGALVATEGGPGYATTGTWTYYLQLMKPLMNQRPLLLMDDRGTGTSQPISCFPLQLQAQFTQLAIQSCGAQLGNTSDLYGSGLDADDLAALIDALELGPVDLYGDSYGTFFGQTFAGRHPAMLRSLVLDSAWPVVGQDPWYPEAGPAANNAFNVACARSPTCQNLPGASMSRIDA
jgi:pimeloyl-ACP methyl ester carboxylesterase